MKTISSTVYQAFALFVLASFALLSVSLQAGEPVAYKQVAPPPPELYGVGFYGAIDGGANVFQNFGDSDFPSHLTDPFFGSGLSLDVTQEHGTVENHHSTLTAVEPSTVWGTRKH